MDVESEQIGTVSPSYAWHWDRWRVHGHVPMGEPICIRVEISREKRRMRADDGEGRVELFGHRQEWVVEGHVV